MRTAYKWSILAALVLGLGVVGDLFIPHAHAAEGAYATFQPDDNNGMWREGQAIRLCAVEVPTSAATVTYPDATTAMVAADSEGCFDFELTQEGAYSVAWTVAGPATRTIGLTAWGPEATNWAYWLTLAVLGGLFLLAAFQGWTFTVAWSLAGLVFHIIEVPFLSFAETVVLVLMGIGLEYVVNRWRLRKSETRTT